MVDVAVQGVRGGCGKYEQPVKIFIYSSLRLHSYLIQRTFLPKSWDLQPWILFNNKWGGSKLEELIMILLSSGLGLGSLKEFIAFALAIETTPSELQHRLVCVVFGVFFRVLWLCLEGEKKCDENYSFQWILGGKKAEIVLWPSSWSECCTCLPAYSWE